MPDVCYRQAQTLARQQETLVRGFIRSGLFSRDDVVELDADGALGFGDNGVIGVGDQGKQ